MLTSCSREFDFASQRVLRLKPHARVRKAGVPGICLKGKVSGGHCTHSTGQSQRPCLGRGLLSHGPCWNLKAPLPIQHVSPLLHLLVARHLEKLSPCFIWQNLGTIIGLGSTGQETKAHRKMPHDSCQPLLPASPSAGQTALPAFGFERGSTFRMWKPHNGSYVLFGDWVGPCHGCSHYVAHERVSPSGLEGSWSVCNKGVRLCGFLKKECVCLSKQNFPAYLEE